MCSGEQQWWAQGTEDKSEQLDEALDEEESTEEKLVVNDDSEKVR